MSLQALLTKLSKRKIGHILIKQRLEIQIKHLYFCHTVYVVWIIISVTWFSHTQEEFIFSYINYDKIQKNKPFVNKTPFFTKDRHYFTPAIATEVCPLFKYFQCKSHPLINMKKRSSSFPILSLFPISSKLCNFRSNFKISRCNSLSTWKRNEV